MTCRDFTDLLPEYVEGSLEAPTCAAADAHVAGCAHCAGARQRAQHSAERLHRALARSVAEVSISPAFTQRLLRAAAAGPEVTPPPPDLRAWHWLTGNPLRTLGATALAALLFVVLQFRDPAAGPFAPDERVALTIDVPFESDRLAGLTHAEFFIPPRNSISP